MIRDNKFVKKDGNRDHMSSEELKTRLYNHFHKTGTLDSLRTQLRNQLVTELFKAATPTKTLEEQVSEDDPKKVLLPLQVSNWLVYDHLKQQGYEYSLSTFVSEAKLSSPGKLLSITDILELLGIESTSPEFKNISSNYRKSASESSLYSLLVCVIKYHVNYQNSNKTVASEKTGTANARNQKPQRDSYDHSSASGVKENTLQTDFRPSKVFSDALYIGRTYDDYCIDSEDNPIFHQKLQLEKDKHEREIQKLRQKLLQELDSIYSHEQQVRLDLEQRKNQLVREQELLQIERDKLKVKELELEKRSANVEKQIEIEQKEQHDNLNLSHVTKELELQSWDAKLKEQQQWLEKEQANFLSQRNDAESLKTKLRHLENSYQSIQKDNSSLVSEKTNLQNKLDSMSDYSALKTEFSMKVKEVEDFKKEISRINSEMKTERQKYTENIQNLQQKVEQHSQETHGQNDNSSKEDVYHLQELVWNQQRQRLEQELRDSKQTLHTLIQRMEEQRDDIHELHRTIHVLHYEMSQQKDAASATHEQNHHVQSHPASPSHHSITQSVRNRELQRPQFPSLSFARPHGIPPAQSYTTRSIQEKYKEEPIKFITEAKRRIDTLQQEAEALEQNYSTFLAAEPNLLSRSYIPYNNSSVDSYLYNQSHKYSNLESRKQNDKFYKYYDSVGVTRYPTLKPPFGEPYFSNSTNLSDIHREFPTLYTEKLAFTKINDLDLLNFSNPKGFGIPDVGTQCTFQHIHNTGIDNGPVTDSLVLNAPTASHQIVKSTTVKLQASSSDTITKQPSNILIDLAESASQNSNAFKNLFSETPTVKPLPQNIVKNPSCAFGSKNSPTNIFVRLHDDPITEIKNRKVGTVQEISTPKVVSNLLNAQDQSGLDHTTRSALRQQEMTNTEHGDTFFSERHGSVENLQKEMNFEASKVSLKVDEKEGSIFNGETTNNNKCPHARDLFTINEKSPFISAGKTCDALLSGQHNSAPDNKHHSTQDSEPSRKSDSTSEQVEMLLTDSTNNSAKQSENNTNVLSQLKSPDHLLGLTSAKSVELSASKHHGVIPEYAVSQERLSVKSRDGLPIERRISIDLDAVWKQKNSTEKISCASNLTSLGFQGHVIKNSIGSSKLNKNVSYSAHASSDQQPSSDEEHFRKEGTHNEDCFNESISVVHKEKDMKSAEESKKQLLLEFNDQVGVKESPLTNTKVLLEHEQQTDFNLNQPKKLTDSILSAKEVAQDEGKSITQSDEALQLTYSENIDNVHEPTLENQCQTSEIKMDDNEHRIDSQELKAMAFTKLSHSDIKIIDKVNTSETVEKNDNEPILEVTTTSKEKLSPQNNALSVGHSSDSEKELNESIADERSDLNLSVGSENEHEKANDSDW